MSSLPGSCTEGGRKHERTDNGPRGGRTLCRGVVRELAQGRYRRGRFALRRKCRDAQPVGAQIDGVPGGRRRREHPRLLAEGLRRHRERRPENPELELGRHDRAPDGVVATGRQPAPASSWTSTVPAVWCAARPSTESSITESSYAIFGFCPAPQRALVRRRIHPVQHRAGQYAEDTGAPGGARQSDRPDLVGQRGISGRDQSADRPPVAVSPGVPAALLSGCTTRSLRYSCSLPRVTSASSPTTFRS